MAFSVAHAAEYPDRLIRIVVPYAAGGTVDFVARQVAQRMSESMGHSVVVENRTGAGGLIGGSHVAGAKPDGYTLLATDSSYTMLPLLYKKLPWNYESDLIGVSTMARTPTVLMVAAASPFPRLSDLLDFARRNPGKLNFGSGGKGTSPHMAMERLNLVAGVDITHVPYKGGAESMVGLISRQIDVLMTSPPTALAQIRSGMARALAVSSARRSSALPDVPTFVESGLPEYVSLNWTGILAPRGVPPEVLRRIQEEVARAQQAPQFRVALAAQGAEPGGPAGEEFQKMLSTETARWKAVAAKAGITPE